jgi:hypothetical protein
LGIGDWGLGIGDWGLGPIPNPQSPIPQSPIPNPQSPYEMSILFKVKYFSALKNRIFTYKIIIIKNGGIRREK